MAVLNDGGLAQCCQTIYNNITPYIALLLKCKRVYSYADLFTICMCAHMLNVACMYICIYISVAHKYVATTIQS